jgi:hypothetical protein
MYTVGESVPQLWSRLSKPDPSLTTKLTGRRSEQMDDTRVSISAPLWMTTLNSYEPSPLMPWDFITKDRKKHLRHAVNDDTAVSLPLIYIETLTERQIRLLFGIFLSESR